MGIQGKLRQSLLFETALWLRNTYRMLRLTSEALGRQRARLPDTESKVAVVVMPWNESDVPWFSIVCGLLLSDAGHNVTFIVDDLPFGDQRWRTILIQSAIKLVTRNIRQREVVKYLSKYCLSISAPAQDSSRIYELAKLNAIRDLRGEMIDKGRTRKINLFAAQLSIAKNAIDNLFEGEFYNTVVVPGGIHASSGIWRHVAEANNMRVTTFDGGINGTALWAMNGVACHFSDIPRVFDRLLSEATPEELNFVDETAQAEIASRQAGSDKFGAQHSGSDSVVPLEFEFDYVLIALNVSWDTQALDRHICFHSICDFIVKTVEHVIRTTELHVVIRQHPAERHRMTRSTEDYGQLLIDTFGFNPRIHYIAPEDSINTYRLMKRSIATIVHTSTIGAEATAHGIPALTGANPYYAQLGAIESAVNLAQYFELLNKLVHPEYQVTTNMKFRAQICYYLSQCNSWITTPFNTGDFAKWGRMKFSQIADDSSQKMLVDSITLNIPISWQNHRRRLSENTLLFTKKHHREHKSHDG